MGKKKVKTSKKGKRRVPREDVQASTGLPPVVEGQLRCFLRVSISKILWMIPKPPDVTYVSLKWWGELAEGTVFRPTDVKNPQKGLSRTTTRYGIRSGPKQFSAYVHDMGPLVFEVLAGSAMTPIGHVQIFNIGALIAPGKPLNGFFTVYSLENPDKKIADLHISMVFEPLMASFESSSVPTTDVSLDTRGSSEVEIIQPYIGQAPQTWPYSKAASSSEEVIATPWTDKPTRKSDEVLTPRGVDDDYSFVIGPGAGRVADTEGTRHVTSTDNMAKQHGRIPVDRTTVPERESGEPQRIYILTDYSTGEPQPRASHPVASHAKYEMNPTSKEGKDLLSTLLERGTRLRNEMIRSELDTQQMASDTGNEETDIPLSGVDKPLPIDSKHHKRRTSTGELFKEILNEHDEKGKVGDINGSSDDIDMEARTVDLVIGDHFTERELKALKAIQGGGSPGSSFSSIHDSVMSDPTDPLHDSSILEELFYKQGILSDSESDYSSDDETRPGSARSMSVDDPANIRPPSRSSIRSQETLETEKDSGIKPSLRRRSASVGSDSESDAMSTSRVSFDGPLDDEHHDVNQEKVEGLSIERLTLLGRVHVARVIIDSLRLDPSIVPVTPVKSRGKSKSRSKPPRPSPSKSKKATTYFMEYQFPVVATSRDKDKPNTMATEVMRVVSKKVSPDGEVTFNHRSVFPVLFDGAAIDKWWKQLLVFKLFSKTAGQKTPSLLGVCSQSLRSVLLSGDLSIGAELEVRDKSQGSSGSSSGRSHNKYLASDSDTSREKLSHPHVGNLRVSIELASDNKDFPMALAKTKAAEIKGTTIIPLPHDQPKKPPPLPPQTETDSGSVQATQTEPVATNVEDMSLKPSLDTHKPLPAIQSRMTGQRVPSTAQPDTQQPQSSQYEALTLHSLLMIPEGRGITLHGVPPPKGGSSRVPHVAPHPLPGVGLAGRDLTVRNTYLVCRMFWCDDVVRSNVCWGTAEPNYDFIQVAPVLVTSSLLERTRSNFMVVEVWDKKTSAENDKLVGIVKLSIHQFYMSFRDRKIANTLLKSQFPVVAVDNFVPIVDPFTGSQFGQLKVVLALGSTEQVSALQRIKLDREVVTGRVERPGQYLERADIVDDRDRQQGQEDTAVEHTFEVVVEGVRGLPQLENAVWGEADCFIQYHFPSQQNQQSQTDGPTIPQAVTMVTPHRTATTLCVPDPTFHDVTRHRMLLPQGSPVQRELLTACAGVGGGAGGIPFEVWCRYYYPNIRDQVIAKGLLPLAKLCAMVTMQKRGEPSVQTFSLPLTMQKMMEDRELDPEQMAKLQDGGLLDVTINYKTSVMPNIHTTHQAAIASKMTGAQVCISVGVIRACGLKTAATALARHDAGLQYAADVGVNAYVKVDLSFLTKQDQRVTRTVARTFAPDFSYHMDFPCPLLWSEAHHDALSLAELLETAEVTFQVWHQVPGFRPEHDVRHIDLGSEGSKITGRKLFGSTGDVLLGCTTIPLESLLTHKTGIKGWHSLNLPSLGWETTAPKVSSSASASASQLFTNKGLERVAGGLEIAITFAHHDDRDRVIHAARGVGWSPDMDIENLDDFLDQEDGSLTSLSSEVSVNLDTAWFPVKLSLIAGQTSLDRHTKAYIRYKFYDRAAVCSKLCYLDVSDEDYITADLKYSHNFHCQPSQPFMWYLREERLEVQLWVSYSTDPSGKRDSRPRHRDKLIGCAYIDTSTLADKRRQHHRISGLYPLFKPGSVDMGGACIRVHINMKPHTGHYDSRDEDEDFLVGSHGDRVHGGHGLSTDAVTRSTQDELTPEDIAAKEREMELERERKRLEEEERERKRPLAMKISVERAMHLPFVADTGRVQGSKPNCYVTYRAGDHTINSAVIDNSDSPVWDHSQDCQITRNDMENNSLVFKVWHRTSSSKSKSPDRTSDRVLGFVSVDLAPLLAGFKQIYGWYNIMDFTGQCQGQIKVGISPLESISPLKRKEKPLSQPASPSQSAKFSSSARYSTFPSHLVQYTEQSVRLETEPKRLHYEEHYESVKKFHESLQEQLKEQKREQRHRDKTDERESSQYRQRQPVPQPSAGVNDPGTSKSFLLNNLRKQMQDLDDMQKNMQEKLKRYEVITPITTEPSRLAPEHIHDSTEFSRNSQDSVDDLLRPGQSSLPQPSHHTRSDKLEDDIDWSRQFGETYKIPAREVSDEGMEYHDVIDGDHRDRHDDVENLNDSVPFSDEESNHDDADVIVPRALNDISSPDFSNFVPEYSRYRQRDVGDDTHSLPSEIARLDTDTNSPVEDFLKQGLNLPPYENQQVIDEEISPWSTPSRGDVGPVESKQLVSRGGSDADKISMKSTADEDEEYSMSEGHERNEQDGYAGDIDESRHEQPPSPDLNVTDSQQSNVTKQSSSIGDVVPGEEIVFQPRQSTSDGVTEEGESPAVDSQNEESEHQSEKDIKTDDESNTDEKDHAEEDLDGRVESQGQPRQEPSRSSSDRADSENSVVLTLCPSTAEQQEITRQEKHQQPLTTHTEDVDVPNFFLPPQDLEASMRALRMATALYPRSEARTVLSDEGDERSQYRSQTRKEYSDRLGTAAGLDKENTQPSVSRNRPSVRPTPTAEETKRIAKIFSARFSNKD
ncbi:C2 domain-containing protein 3-like [Glandiceps talaboti]